MPIVDLSALSANLQTDKQDYEKIFGLLMANGFDAKDDFVRLGITKEVELIRDELSNIVQPGRTGVTNFTAQAIAQKKRIGRLRPAKVDLKLTELELYQLRISYLGRRQPSDPKDINSVAGREYLISRVMARIGKEVNRAIVRGVENPATGTTGGLNLFDGLGLKFTQGYTTVANGGVGDIPATNKVATPASSVTQANVLGELKKMVEIIYESEDLQEYTDEDASFFMPKTFYQHMVNALDSALSNGSQVVQRNADGTFSFKLLPNTIIKPRSYMTGVDNMFWTPDGNLFWLHQDTEEDVPMMKFQEQDRDLKIFIDFEASVEYAQGRVIVLYK